MRDTIHIHNAYTHTHAYMHTYIHTYIHTYTHMQRERDATSELRRIRLGQIRQDHTPEREREREREREKERFNERATPELADWDRYAKLIHHTHAHAHTRTHTDSTSERRQS